jgi:hypothetical protein
MLIKKGVPAKLNQLSRLPVYGGDLIDTSGFSLLVAGLHTVSSNWSPCLTLKLVQLALLGSTFNISLVVELIFARK